MWRSWLGVEKKLEGVLTLELGLQRRATSEFEQLGQQDQHEPAAGKEARKWKHRQKRQCCNDVKERAKQVQPPWYKRFSRGILCSYNILLPEQQDRCTVPTTLGVRHLNWKQNDLHMQVTRSHHIESRKWKFARYLNKHNCHQKWMIVGQA